MFSHSFGGWKFEIKAPARSGSGESSLLGLQMATGRESSGISSSSPKGTNPFMRPAALGPHLILLITPKAPPPGTHHTAGLGLQHTIGAGDKTQPTAGSAVIWPSSQWQALPSFIKFRVLLPDPPYICPSHCRYLRSSLLLQDHRQLRFPMNQLRLRDAAELNVASRQLPVASPRVRDHAPPSCSCALGASD